MRRINMISPVFKVKLVEPIVGHERTVGSVLDVKVAIGGTLGYQYFSTFDDANTRRVKLGLIFKETNKNPQVANRGIQYKDIKKRSQQAPQETIKYGFFFHKFFDTQ